jgi:hypothetical protein
MSGLEGLGPCVWSMDVVDTIADLAWSPSDGRLGVGCSDGRVVVIDADGDVVDRRLRHPAGTVCVTWFEGEVASGSVDGWVEVGDQRHRVGGWVSALTSGDDGLGVAHGRRVSILGTSTSEPLPATVAHLRWAATGEGTSGLVACGHGYVREFDADLSNSCDANLVWGGTLEAVDWSLDGRWAAAGTRGTTNYLWPRPVEGDRAGMVVDPAIHVHVLPCPTSDGRLARFDPTGRYLGIATTNGGLAVFDLDEVHPIAGPSGRLLPLFCRVNAFAWWPDAPVALLGVATPTGGGGLLLVRCDDSAAPVGVVDLDAPVTHVAWSPHGGPLAVACENGAVTVFERDTEWDWAASDGRWDVTDQL